MECNSALFRCRTVGQTETNMTILEVRLALFIIDEESVQLV